MIISKNKVISSVFCLLFLFIAFYASRPVLAANANLIGSQVGLNEVGTVYGGTEPQDIRILVLKIIRIALSFIGLIFFGLTIFAGFQYMTAAGNQDQTKKALALLKNAIIGLIIILMSWAITQYSIIMLSKAANNAFDATYYPSW